MADDIDIEALYRRYGDMVLGRCRALLGNEADAQEVTQDVFIKLMRYADSFRREAKWSTFLFKIATTTCLNRLRTRRRRPEVMYDEPPPIVSHDTLLKSVELRNLVDVLLDGFDEGVQECVIFYYVDGLTLGEISELVGVTTAAVRKRITKFRNQVRAQHPDWMVSPP